MINWPVGVNQIVRRNSDGELADGVILETTRCGKKKSRPSNQLAPDSFNVEMLFNRDEFVFFRNWWKFELRKSVLTFAFPDILSGIGMSEYRIIGRPRWSNPTSEKIIVNMTWEEV